MTPASPGDAHEDRRWADDTPRRYPTAAEQFGRVVKAIREKAGLTLRDLEKLSGVSRAVIGKIEQGIQRPSIAVTRKLDDALEAQGALDQLGEPARAEPYLHLPPAKFFLGRRRELTRLTALARAHRPGGDRTTVIVVAGAPGAGKTALALRWANAMQDLYDTVLFSDLRGYSAGTPAEQADVLGDLLRGLGIAVDRIPHDETRRALQLTEHLRRQPQRVLVLLDNAAGSHQVLPLLPALPGCTVLVTTRLQPSVLVIEADASVVPLAIMDESDAVGLMTALIGEDRAVAEPDEVAQLVELCGALPLAMVVAAERVAATPNHSIRRHVSELTDVGRRMRLLDLDDPTIGVRGAFTLSYRALPAAEARMFRLLGLFPGVHIGVQAAAALAGTSTGEAAMLLDELVQAHLLQLDRGQYAFHDLMRVFAAESSAEEPEEQRNAAVARLVRWYLHAVNASAWALTPTRDHHVALVSDTPVGELPVFGDFDTAYQWCTRELPNFVPVARLALRHELLFETWRMMIELFEYFAHALSWQTWIEGYQTACRAAEALGDRERLAEAQIKLADGYRSRGDHAEAVKLETRVVEAAGGGPSNSNPVGWALQGLGITACREHRYADAIQLIHHAVETFVVTDSWIGEAYSRQALGEAYCALAVSDQADDAASLHAATGGRDLYGRWALEFGHGAMDLFLANDDRHGAARARCALARSCRLLGDLDAALRHSEAAVAGFPAADVHGRAAALAEHGQVLAALGAFDAAAEAFRAAIGLVEEHDGEQTEQVRMHLAALPSAGGA